MDRLWIWYPWGRNWPNPKHLHGERYYLEDGTMSMSEPRIENCGIVQGSHWCCWPRIGDKRCEIVVHTQQFSDFVAYLPNENLTFSRPWLSCSFVSYWFLCLARAHNLVELPGSFLKRQRIPRDDGRGTEFHFVHVSSRGTGSWRGCIGPEDLRCGIEIHLFGRTKQTKQMQTKIKTNA